MTTALHSPTVVEYALDRRAAELLRSDVRALVDSGVRPSEPEFYDRHWLDAELLPVGLRDFLRRFRMTESHAACVVSGLPAANFETPPHWNEHGSVSPETILGLCALSLGDPFSSASVQDGRMVQNLLPYDDERRDLHTENGPHCDYLLLLALSSASITLTSVRDLNLDAGTREILARPRFVFEWGWAPVLFGDQIDPYLRFDRCRPADPAAGRALDLLRAELDRVRQDLVLAPGSLLVVDNYRTAHGRPGDGWLKRITVSRNLRRVANDRHPRILP